VWHWGDNGPVKAFVIASPVEKSGLVAFLNSQNGLSMVPALIRDARGRPSAALSWLDVQEPVPALAAFVQTMRRDGVARALDEYRAARRARPEDPRLTQRSVNGIGYAFLRDRKPHEAVLVFELNVEDYPDAWNAHDSLGEALAAAGETARAIEAYERSLELNPGNSGAVDVLKKLGQHGEVRALDVVDERAEPHGVGGGHDHEHDPCGHEQGAPPHRCREG
jgi:tetratricopeptide (TPR) repeat protein